MSISQNWVAKFAGRVLISAFLGGLFTALIGALSVATAGALFGWILDLRSTPPVWDSGFLFPGAWIGAYLGSYSGIVGFIAAAVAALASKPETSIVPARVLRRNLALGQLLGTFGAVSSYLLFAFAVAQFNGDSFVGTVENHLDVALYGVPALMICGAIMGALWKREPSR